MVLVPSAMVAIAVYSRLCSCRHAGRMVAQVLCVVWLAEGCMLLCDLLVLLKVVMAALVWSRARALVWDVLARGGEAQVSNRCRDYVGQS